MGLIKTLLLVNGVPVRPTTKRQRNHKQVRQQTKLQREILAELKSRPK